MILVYFYSKANHMEFIFWVVRYSCVTLLFLIGLKAPGLPSHTYSPVKTEEGVSFIFIIQYLPQYTIFDTLEGYVMAPVVCLLTISCMRNSSYSFHQNYLKPSRMNLYDAKLDLSEF